MNLITREKSFKGSFLTLARQLTLDDFDITYESEKENKRYVRFGKKMSIKNNILDELFNPEFPEEPFLNINLINNKVIQVSRIVYHVPGNNDEEINYKHKQELDSALSEWNSDEINLTKSFLQRLAVFISRAMDENNLLVKKELNDLADNPEKIDEENYFEDVLTEKEQDKVSLKNEEIKKINEQIESLLKSKSLAEKEITYIKRDGFIKDLRDNYGDKTNESLYSNESSFSL